MKVVLNSSGTGLQFTYSGYLKLIAMGYPHIELSNEELKEHWDELDNGIIFNDSTTEKDDLVDQDYIEINGVYKWFQMKSYLDKNYNFLNIDKIRTNPILVNFAEKYGKNTEYIHSVEFNDCTNFLSVVEIPDDVNFIVTEDGYFSHFEYVEELHRIWHSDGSLK